MIDAPMPNATTADSNMVDRQPQENNAEEDNPEVKSPEFMARFVVAARVAYKVDDADNTDPVSYSNLMKDVISKGYEYIKDAQHDDRGNRKFVPYRCFIKALLIQALASKAVEDRKNNQAITTLSHNIDFGDDHFAVLEEFLANEKEKKKLKLVFNHTKHLSTYGMHFFFDVISNDTGNSTVDMGDDGIFKIIDRITFRIREYFSTHFFPSMKKKSSKNRISNPGFMVLIKFIADSTVYGRSEKLFIKPGTSANLKKDRVTISAEAWKHTAIFVEEIYNTWNIYMTRTGFEGVEEFLRMFLYYDQKTGKLQVLNNGRVFEKTEKLFMPMKSGKRNKNIIVHMEQSNEATTGNADENLGIKRNELDDKAFLKHIKDETYDGLVNCARRFLIDIYNSAMEPTILSTKKGSIKESVMFLRYKMDEDDSEFPQCFSGVLSQKFLEIKRDIEGAKKVANIQVQEDTAERYEPELTPQNADTIVESYPCPPNCQCADLKIDVENEGTNFPQLLVTTTSNFMESMKKIKSRRIEGEVQLVLTNPYTQLGDQAVLEQENIGNIVQSCNTLLRPGGHVFLKTTPEHIDTVMKAFKTAKGPAEQVVFTVDAAPYIIMTSPNDQRGRTGYDGPTFKSVTLMYVHATKLGSLTLPAAHERAKTRNRGHTDSKYHSSTNVLDAALEMRSHGYEVSLKGAKEIVDRYSGDNDIVIDFCADNSWTAMACISLKQSRLYIGGVPTEAAKDELTQKLAECIIYQAGQEYVTTNMNYLDESITKMVGVYNSHKYADRYNPVYGLGEWIGMHDNVGSLPMLSTIPTYLFDHISVIQSNPIFSSHRHTGVSPNAMRKATGRLLAPMEAGEILRVAASRLRLYMDSNSQYTKDGLRTLYRGMKGHVIGTLFGVVINGGWKENKKELQGLGNGLFEFDEYVTEEKYFPLNKVFRARNAVDQELDDLRFIPSKFCPFRYAKFTKKGGNTYIRVNGDAKILKKDIHLYQNYEVVQTKIINKDDAIVINVSRVSLNK